MFDNLNTYQIQTHKYNSVNNFITACIHREKQIEDLIAKIIGNQLAVVMYIAFSFIIMLFEELLVAVVFYQIQAKIIKMTPNLMSNFPSLTPNFHNLEDESREQYSIYFNTVANTNSRRILVMAREASIQLVYQLTIILYELFYHPLNELDYQDSKYPTAVWIGFLGFRIFSLFLSANSTFTPLLDGFTISSYRRCQKPPTLLERLVKIVQILIHIFMCTGVIFLMRVIKQCT